MVSSRPERELGLWNGVVLVTTVFLGLNLVLRVPDLLVHRFPLELDFYLSDPSRLYYFFSLDLFCLFTVLVLVPVRRGGKWLYYGVTGLLFLLLVYRSYDALVTSTLGRDPIFYADSSQVVGAFYLFLNEPISAWRLVGLVGVGGGLCGLLWSLPAVLHHIHRRMRSLPLRHVVLATHLVLWPLVGFAAVQERGIERQTYQEVCFLTAQCIGYNVRASVDLRRATARKSSAPVDSTYRRYDAVDWSARPSIYLVMVESYGTFLSTDPRISDSYERLMERAADSLRVSGWRTATAESAAPVFGGLSWLSVATVLTGTPVEHQPTYEVLRPKLPRYPHLEWLFQKQGYETATLQPPVRARPGLRVRNPYSFDRTFYFDDLDYKGPKYGWGVVPDQYSLSVAHEHFVETASKPFFVFFETVTSHGRWARRPPSLVDDPEVLNRMPKHVSPSVQKAASLGQTAVSKRSDSRSQHERFFRHIRYDWRVLVKYLRTKAPRKSLVIVLGDHQPFFAESRSFTTPLHVLSQDQTLIAQFETYGFVPGLQLSSEAETFNHAGLYSLLARVLTAHGSSEDEVGSPPLPPYHPRGVARAALFDADS